MTLGLRRGGWSGILAGAAGASWVEQVRPRARSAAKFQEKSSCFCRNFKPQPPGNPARMITMIYLREKVKGFRIV